MAAHISINGADPDDPKNDKKDQVDTLVASFLDELAALSHESGKPPEPKPPVPAITPEEKFRSLWNEPEPEAFAPAPRKRKLIVAAAAAVALALVLGILGYRFFAADATTVNQALAEASPDRGKPDPDPGAPISLPPKRSADSVNKAAAVAASGSPVQISKSRSSADSLVRHITEQSSDGANITLDDKSRWQIFPLDRSHISL